jgi:bis(5'-nucleosyl)-tetraphosphatase (symmetrical)
MRYLDPVTQCIDFRFKGYPVFEHQGLKPWFELLNRQMFQDQRQIIFGHWSALTGLFNWPGVIGLDTGCVWGGSLTAYCIETGRLITQENCEIKKSGLMRAD